MRIVGAQDRCEVEPDPALAWRRARRLDAMLRAASPAWACGVTRGTREAMAQQDALRALTAARRINRR